MEHEFKIFGVVVDDPVKGKRLELYQPSLQFVPTGTIIYTKDAGSSETISSEPVAWSIPSTGQFSFEKQDERFWTALYTVQPTSAPAVVPDVITLLDWAVSRWNDEVKHRPLVNKNRRTLDDTWRQVVRFAGGDPDELLGPCHDDLITSA